MSVWDTVKAKLSTKLTAESFQNWFADTRLDSEDGDTLWVSVPSEAAKQYVEQEYSSLIQSAIRELKLPFRQVCYTVRSSPCGPGEAAGNGNHESGPMDVAGQLNPRFTFGNFVVGSSNQFAHAAARAVADRPGRTYNPLFIHAGVGLGKTHLIHAVGHALIEQHRGLRVLYTPSERFMNDMIRCIRQQRMQAFREAYRKVDVLLVDDIHILAGKEATQEEFFHTFNELYAAEKQIVMTSDSPPKDIPGLVDRLRSRFGWGLMADIQPPDLETKMAILDRKAEAEGIELPEDVRIFIATRVHTSVRELEGALTRVLAHASLTGAPISLCLAQQALKGPLPNHEQRITIESILKAVAAKFELQPAQLKVKTNSHNITYPRQIAMYLAKELTSASLPEIGRAFGGKHHTTVLYSIRKIERQRQYSPELNRLIHSLSESLH